jgi:hypothetical protein
MELRRIKNWLESEQTLTFFDKVITNEAALVVGTAFFFAVQYLGWWDWIEPLLSLVVLPTAAASWYEYWRAKTRRYTTVAPGQEVIIAVCVKQAVGESIQEKFGRPPDVFISTEKELGHVTLSTQEMSDMAKRVAKECLRFQHREIVLLCACPAAMAAQIGALVGVHKFKIRHLNFGPGQFNELPILTVDDMPG